MTSPAEHAATIRDALDRYANHERSASFHVALAALLTQAEQAEHLHRAFNAEVRVCSERTKLFQAAEARADQLQEKLDQLANVESTWELLQRADQLQRERDIYRDRRDLQYERAERAEVALRQIADDMDGVIRAQAVIDAPYNEVPVRVRDIARAALADSGETA